MKKARKGFTLVELLIVVAILAALSAAMMASSSDAIDQAQANAIISNLQSMKTAAYTMYTMTKMRFIPASASLIRMKCINSLRDRIFPAIIIVWMMNMPL